LVTTRSLKVTPPAQVTVHRYLGAVSAVVPGVWRAYIEDVEFPTTARHHTQLLPPPLRLRLSRAPIDSSLLLFHYPALRGEWASPTLELAITPGAQLVLASEEDPVWLTLLDHRLHVSRQPLRVC